MIRWVGEHPVLIALLAGGVFVAGALVIGGRFSWAMAIFLALFWGLLSALPWLVRRSRGGPNSA